MCSCLLTFGAQWWAQEVLLLLPLDLRRGKGSNADANAEDGARLTYLFVAALLKISSTPPLPFARRARKEGLESRGIACPPAGSTGRTEQGRARVACAGLGSSLGTPFTKAVLDLIVCICLLSSPASIPFPPSMHPARLHCHEEWARLSAGAGG